MMSRSQLDDIKSVLARSDLRSADRANMLSMLHLLEKGEALDYQQRQNLWAYRQRYSIREARDQR